MIYSGLMRHTKGKLIATALVLSTVLASSPCAGKITSQKPLMPKKEVKEESIQKPKKVEKKEADSGLITCMLDSGLWQETVQEGDVLLPRISGMARAADVYAIFIQKVGEDEVKLNISTSDDPGRPVSLNLKFGEMKEIGKGEKLRIKAKKKSKEGTVGLRLTLDGKAAPLKIEDLKFEEKPDTIFYIFDSNGYVTKVQEGELVFGLELDGLFEAAGVRTIKIKNVHDEEMEIEVRMIDNPGMPVPVRIGFGEEKKVGAGKKLDVKAYKMAESETIGLMLKEETCPIADADFFSIRPCNFNDGICTSSLSEGSIVYSGIGGYELFEGAGLKSVLIDKIGKDEVKIKVRMEKNPEKPVKMKLKFGETAEIGEGEKLRVKAEKGDKPKTVEMTLKSKDAAESGQTDDKKIFKNWSDD